MSKLKILTPPMRVVYPHLWEPHSFKNEEKAYYRVTLIARNTDPGVADFVSQSMAAFAELLPPAARASGEFKKPWKRGADKEGEPGFGAGTLYITPKTLSRIGVVDINGNPIDSDAHPHGVYNGCYVQVFLTPFVYGGGNTGYELGGSFFLGNVRKVGDGEVLPVGGPAAHAEFANVPAPALPSGAQGLPAGGGGGWKQKVEAQRAAEQPQSAPPPQQQQPAQTSQQADAEAEWSETDDGDIPF